MERKKRMEFTGLMDYHLHTAVTIDGKMDESSACNKALSMGIKEIAFTNHVMLTQPDYTMTPASFLDHWEKIQACQLQFPELIIRLGIEMDYYLNREDEIAATLRYYEKLIRRPFDLVLGSVHEVGGSFFSNKHLAPAFFKDKDLISLFVDYFFLATKAVQSGLFDVIAHPDLIKKYTNELTPPIPFANYFTEAEKFVEALTSMRVGLEVNTKGLKQPVGEMFPSNHLLKLYVSYSKKHGVEPILTLGSDAHKVDDVGFRINEAMVLLWNLGIKRLTRFENRKKYSLELSRIE